MRENADTVKISWSGGKDSTAACYLHLEAGHNCKIVYYVPMFDDEIPLISKRHYDFILRQANEWKNMGGGMYAEPRGFLFGITAIKSRNAENTKAYILDFP